VRKDVLETTNGKQVPWENSSLTGQFYFKPAKTTGGGAAEIAALRAEIARLKANQAALPKPEQEQLANLEQKLEAETVKADGEPSPDESSPDESSRVIAVEPAAGKPPQQTQTANLAPATPPDTDQPVTAQEPEALAEVDQAALRRDIQTKLKALNCYRGPIDGDWGRGTRAGVETFNRIANLELNETDAEQATLDALGAWTGDPCPAKTIVHQKRAPAPKAAQPKTRAKTKPTYAKKPAYKKKPKQASESHDFETDAVHRLLRPAR